MAETSSSSLSSDTSLSSSSPPLPYKGSDKKIANFFGDENANDESNKLEYMQQPKHVEGRRMDKLFGTTVTPGVQPIDHYKETNHKQSDAMESHRKLQKFFGFNFDVSQEQYYARVQSSIPQTKTDDDPTGSTPKSSSLPSLSYSDPNLATQPANVDITKLNHFFGLRVDVPKSDYATLYNHIQEKYSQDDKSFLLSSRSNLKEPPSSFIESKNIRHLSLPNHHYLFKNNTPPPIPIIDSTPEPNIPNDSTFPISSICRHHPNSTSLPSELKMQSIHSAIQEKKIRLLLGENINSYQNDLSNQIASQPSTVNANKLYRYFGLGSNPIPDTTYDDTSLPNPHNTTLNI